MEGIGNQFPLIIWDQILNYCNGMDICQMRVVCKRWRELVTENKQWKNFFIKLESQSKVENFLKHINKHGFDYLPVHSLTLEKLEDSNELKLILETLGSYIFCLNVISSPVFGCIAFAELYNLERLEISWQDIDPENIKVPTSWGVKKYRNMKAISCFWPDEALLWGKRILFEMIDVVDCFQLEELKITYSAMDDVHYMKLIQMHGTTLRHLEIRFNTKPYLRYLDSWAKTFKGLKNLRAMIISGNCNLKFAQTIFTNLPSKAPLKAVELDGIVDADDALLKLIFDKWFWSLQSLHIRFNRGITMKSSKEIWRARKQFLDLELAYCKEFNIQELLRAVAVERNCVMRRLSCHYLQNIGYDTTRKLAICLPNLEILDLSYCYAAVTNKSLSWIFRYQTRLKILNLSGSLKISDATDEYQEKPEWYKYPITRLKSLESLSLNSCCITTEFVDLIKIPYLRTLHICACITLHFDDFCTIAENCPALEDLDVSICDGFTDEALYFICDNLKRLTKLDFQNCDGISPEATQYAKRLIKKIRYSGDTKIDI